MSKSLVIPDSRLEQALTFLAETDEHCAELKANVARTEHMAKVAEALAYKVAEGKAAEDRKQAARCTPTVLEAWERHFVAMKDHETLRAQRERHGLVIEVWRSLQANRRMGHVQ